MCAKTKKTCPIYKWAGYTLLAVGFGWLLLKLDLSAVWAQLTALPLGLLGLLLGLQVVTQLLIALQWHQLTNLVLGRSRFVDALHMLTRGTVVEAITPGAKIGGEATRLYLLKKECACTTSQGVSIIALQKTISMSVLLTICLVSLLHVGRHIATHLSVGMQVVTGAVNMAVVCAMVGLIFFAKPLSRWLSHHQGKGAQKIGGYLATYATATQQLSRGHWWGQLAISTVVWLLFPLKMAILAAAMEVRLPFVVLLSVTMVSYMMGLFPLTPGGIGTFEGAMVALLSLLGVGSGVGLPMTLVFRFVTFWFVVLGSAGFVGCYQLFLNLKGGNCRDKIAVDPQSS